MLPNNLMRRLGLGALSGGVGTVALQGLRSASQKGLSGTMAPIGQEPGSFVVKRTEQALALPRERVPDAAESAAANALGLGYGLTAGALYGLLRPRGGEALTDGALLGLGVWAAGYLGWLPALGLMPPLTQQRPKQVVAPAPRARPVRRGDGGGLPVAPRPRLVSGALR